MRLFYYQTLTYLQSLRIASYRSYIHQGQGGDQFVGRTASGLPMNDCRFAALPPRFANDEPVLSDEEWVAYIPGWRKYPASFRKTIPYLLASVVYHSDWLRRTLDAAHPLLHSRFFRDNIPSRLKPKVLTGTFYCEKTRMTATGIPSHLVLAKEFQDAKNAIVAKMSALEKQVVRSNADLSRDVSALPETVTTNILSHCQVNGAVPITAVDLQRVHTGIMDAVREEIRNELRRATRGEVTATGGDAAAAAAAGDEDNGALTTRLYQWPCGALRRVPHTFVFPRCCTKSMWDAWWRGDANQDISPYRFLTAQDMPTKNDKVKLSRALKVMDKLVSAAVECNAVTGDRTKVSIARKRAVDQDEIFDRAFIHLVDGLPHTTKRRRVDEAAYGTVYNWLMDKNCEGDDA
jgi:hypothetical protein